MKDQSPVSYARYRLRSTGEVGTGDGEGTGREGRGGTTTSQEKISTGEHTQTPYGSDPGHGTDVRRLTVRHELGVISVDLVGRRGRHTRGRRRRGKTETQITLEDPESGDCGLLTCVSRIGVRSSLVVTPDWGRKMSLSDHESLPFSRRVSVCFS